MTNQELIIEFAENREHYDRLGRLRKVPRTEKARSKKSKDYLNFIDTLFERTNFLPDKFNLTPRLKALQQGMDHESFLCPVCGEDRHYRTGEAIFSLTCDKKDKEHNDYVQEKRQELHEENFLKNHGVRNCMHLSETVLKVKKTNLARRGVDNPMKDPNIVSKLIINNNLKFGGNSPMCSSIIKKKWVEGQFKKYGFKNYQLEHYNKENYYKLSYNYILKNFITVEGYLKLEQLMSFINCSGTAAFKLCREHGIYPIKRPGVGGFDPHKPAILYYLKHIESGYYKSGITNLSIFKRFGKKSKEFVVLNIENFENGKDARDREKEILEEYTEHRIYFEEFKNNGATEFFSRDILGLDSSE